MNRPRRPSTLTPVRAQLAFAELLIAVANARPHAQPRSAAVSSGRSHRGQAHRQSTAGAPLTLSPRP
ncbi:MAG TPA: hypothetical protein PLE80_09840 [Opitutaceae bacterium]|nr:hypothetical protein [Opitutaceae bacterium]